MWRVLLLSVLLAITYCQVKEDDIWQVNSKQLKIMVTKNKAIFVMFSRNDCHFCEAAWKVFKSSASMITTGSPGMKGAPCAHFNITDDPNAVQEWSLQGVPTFRLYTNQTYYEYKGEFDKYSIEKFVEKANNPSVLVMTRTTELEFFEGTRNITVLFMYPRPAETDGDGRPLPHPWVPSYKNVARRFIIDRPNEFIFQYTFFNEEAKKKWNVPENVSIIVWTQRGEKINFYRGELEEEPLYNYIYELGKTNLHTYTADLVDFLFFRPTRNIPSFFYITDSDLDDTFQKELIALGKQFRDKLHVVHVQHHQYNNATNRLFSFLGIKDIVFPYVAIFDYKNGQRKFHLPIKQDINRIKIYIEAFLTNQLSPSLKSQPVPTTQNSSLSTELVGKSYKAFLSQQSHPTLVNFYAPWCNHTIAFQPQYEALQQEFQGRVTFANIDASENEVEDFFVPYFPTLKLYYPKTKKYVDYEGELSAESLGEFLKQRVQHGHDDL